MTISQALNWASKQLKKADIKSANLDAEILLIAILRKYERKSTRINKTFLYSHPEITLTQNQIKKFKNYIARRKKHEPVAYIIGYKEFFELNFLVNKHALIPRPETEILVEEALKIVSKYPVLASIRSSRSRLKCQRMTVVDVGTGSGCIIISILKKLLITDYPPATPEHSDGGRGRLPITFYAVDISKKAVRLAQKNATLHKVEKYITFKVGNLLEPVKNKKIDIIVANLPYLSKDLKHLKKRDISREPKKALFTDEKGLFLIKKLLFQIKNLKYKPKFILLEIDPGQKVRLKKIINQVLPKTKINFKKDLAGLVRIAVIKNQ